MDVHKNDYVEPYEEAEAEAPAAEETSDDSDENYLEAESYYEEKSFGLLQSGNHRVRNPDDTFRCPFCSRKKKQNYKLKDLLQHADGIDVSSKHCRHDRERTYHCAFARFIRTDPPFAHDLAIINDKSVVVAWSILYNYD
ncbi:hypothetical protein GUJ93_ZPchr0007g3602 [Zizania palustris]|uniref:Zinc finger-XS domain-containing protein n=1 Tax=Zizania palustris TaxID=103762 RepID=A0A8J5TCN4_ZIZPA|nr:hypothetical protein GUJ93_ZPchr0007g3602 [Zizania palustris]